MTAENRTCYIDRQDHAPIQNSTPARYSRTLRMIWFDKPEGWPGFFEALLGFHCESCPRAYHVRESGAYARIWCVRRHSLTVSGAKPTLKRSKHRGSPGAALRKKPRRGGAGGWWTQVGRGRIHKRKRAICRVEYQRQVLRRGSIVMHCAHSATQP
jgi:hypothetical protein